MADKGCTAIELCGGFGIRGTYLVQEAVKGKARVGAVRFDLHPGLDTSPATSSLISPRNVKRPPRQLGGGFCAFLSVQAHAPSDAGPRALCRASAVVRGRFWLRTSK